MARALVAMKQEADQVDAERSGVSRWRRGKRAELAGTVDDLREQEKKLLQRLGGQR